jgi:hypothetical protein
MKIMTKVAKGRPILKKNKKKRKVVSLSYENSMFMEFEIKRS